MYHDLKVDGVSLKGYKVYINGTGAYDSAERDVEFIEIPGRSGAFALDKKRFKNITVQYNSGTFAENQPEFARKISDLRNFLASRNGYVRIEDDYNPEEYRMGVFSRGLEFDPVCYNMASEFPIEFNCKPQRFLKIGDLPVSVASGDVLTNPTLFDAHPLIKFNSNGNDGTINLGNEQIKVLNSYIGNIPLNLSASNNEVAINNASSFNSGDIIKFNGASINVEYASNGQSWLPEVTARDGLNGTGYLPRDGGWGITLKSTEMTFTAGIPSTVTQSLDVKVVRQYVAPATEETHTFTLSVAYDGTNKFAIAWTIPAYTVFPTYRTADRSNYVGSVNSTKSSLEGVDIYIDLDIGEAYSVDSSDNVVSLNNFANLGGELPALPPGSTTISYSNTISNVEITPHWWRV